MSKKDKKNDSKKKLDIFNIVFVVAVCVTCFPYFIIMSLLENRTIKSYIIYVDELIENFTLK